MFKRFALSLYSLVLQVTSAHPDWLAQCLPCSRSLREAPRWRVNILGGSQVVCKCFWRLPGVGLYFAIFGRVPGGVLIFWEAPRLIAMSCN